MLADLISRLNLALRAQAFAAAPQVRVESCPPAAILNASSWKNRLPGRTRAKLTPLESVRLEFAGALRGIDTVEAEGLAARIVRARSLRDLWHLRTEVFNVVSRGHNQAEASLRLAQLNRHFPTRSPRSGFGALDELPSLPAQATPGPRVSGN